MTSKNALKVVNTLIEYFEHPNDLEFNENDYKKSIEKKISFSKTQSLKTFYNI